MERRSGLLIVCLLLAAPSWALAQSPSAAGQGEVYVYLQPLAADSERMSFSIETVSAVGDQGAATPLRLALTDVRAPDSRRQQLLASARLPEGQYAGLTIKVRKATLRRDNRDAALLVADTAERVDAPFVVTRAKVVVVWLLLGSAGPGTDVAFSPAWSAHLAPRPIVGRAAFVSNPKSSVIVVIDKRLRQAAGVIAVAGGPSGMALDRRVGRLYVACSRGDEVQVVDVASNEVVDRARLSPGDGPRELALSPDGRLLLSANPGSNSVTVFDASPLTRLERIEVGSGPGSLAVEPAGRRAFVFNTLGSTISVVDIARREVVATISTESAPLRGQFSARGDKLFVIHDRSPYLTVIDTRQLTIEDRARLRMAGGALKVDERRGVVYVGGRDEPLVEFYDPGTLLPVDFIKTRAGISHMAIDVEENSLYIVEPGTTRLAVGSLADRKVVSEIDVGDGAFWVAVMGER